MLKRFLSAVGLGGKPPSTSGPPHHPYSLDAANFMYNLLFCDDPSAFAAGAGEEPTAWQATLGSSPPDAAALRALIDDESQEGRIRYVACQKLRSLGLAPEPKKLLGIIVEVPLGGGMDTLAGFSEGGVRYINQSGKIAVVEGVPEIAAKVQELFAVAQPTVDAIGPWTEPRKAPPSGGSMRVSFLVSDGLYFGEAPMSVLQRDPLAAPIIQRATELLLAVVALQDGKPVDGMGS
jgi:hypothetical protein